jgi:tetratricopeptide (TPR) repeat protein
MSPGPKDPATQRALWLLRSASGLFLSQLLGVAAHAQAASDQGAAAAAGSEAIATAPEQLRRTGVSALELASQGYAALQAGSLKTAADRFTAALERGGLDPATERTVILSLSDTLMALNEPTHAAAVLSLVRSDPATDYDTASRLAFALDKAGKRPEAAAAFGAAARIAPGVTERTLMLKARVYELTALERGPEALADARALAEVPALGREDAVSMAYVAVKFKDDRLAMRFFQRADGLAPLTGDQALDAAYCARRLGDDAAALRFFKASLKGRPPSREEAQKRYQIRRAVADLSRKYGVLAGVFYDDAGVFPTALPHSGHGNLQVGGEAYYRPFGYNDGRPIDLFARAFVTTASKAGGTVGPHTWQGWVGVRAKPFADLNFVVEGSRLFKIGSASISDWEARAAFSATTGMDLRQDKSSWPLGHLYVDVAQLIDRGETFAVAEARVGRVFRMADSRLLAAPFLGAYAAHDSALTHPSSLGFGPGVWLRQWFNESADTAPRSTLDMVVQYRFRIGGDERASGFFLTFSASL